MQNLIPRFLKNWMKIHSIPFARAYIRHSPFGLGKLKIWNRFLDQYFKSTSFYFVSSTFFGSTIAGTTQDLIQRYIYCFGIWEPQLTKWISQRLTVGDSFVDVGANIGYFSLLASTLVGASGRVVAIEASPAIFSILQENLDRNFAGNVRGVKVAAAEHKQTVKVFKGPETNIGLTSLIQNENFGIECEVEAMPLSDILRSEEIKSARLIKIDVEGAEWMVVRGMIPIFDSCRDDLEIIVEISPELLAKQGKSAHDIVSIFRSFEFHAYSIENDYSPLSYLTGFIEKRPMRIRVPIEQETDVVFSRYDTESL